MFTRNGSSNFYKIEAFKSAWIVVCAQYYEIYAYSLYTSYRAFLIRHGSKSMQWSYNSIIIGGERLSFATKIEPSSSLKNAAVIKPLDLFKHL